MLSAGLEAFAKATLATGAFMSTVPKSTGATDGEKATLDTMGDVPEPGVSAHRRGQSIFVHDHR